MFWLTRAVRLVPLAFALVLAAGALPLSPIIGRELAGVAPALGVLKTALIHGQSVDVWQPFGGCSQDAAHLAIKPGPAALGTPASPYLAGWERLMDGDSAGAIHFLERMGTAHRTQVSLLMRGSLAFAAGREPEAYALWEEAGAGEYFMTLGGACLRLGDRLAWQRYYAAALEVTPSGDMGAYARLVDQFALIGDRARLHRALEGYLTTGPPETAATLIRVAQAYLALDDVPTANQTAARAMELAPGEAEVWYTAGRAAYAAQNRDLAQARFNQALALDPQHVGACMYLGVLAQEEGELDAAAGWFERALSASRENAWPLARLAELRVKQGRYGEGLKLAQRLMAVERRSFAPALAAEAAMGAGEWALARGYIEEALALEPDNAEYQWRRALVCRGLSDVACAREALNALLRLDPGRTAAQAALAQLDSK